MAQNLDLRCVLSPAKTRLESTTKKFKRHCIFAFLHFCFFLGARLNAWCLNFFVFGFLWFYVCLFRYPPAEEIATAAHPDFPTDQNLTGLSWFGCKAENNQYPINSTAPEAYTVGVQQLLRRAYYASVSFFDSNFGQLMETVDQLGLTDKIVVLFHADHGYQLGERNIWCKETCFNLATHVPLIVRSPFTSPGAGPTATEAMVELVDMYPTLVDLAGVPPLDPTKRSEPALEGRSILLLLQEVQGQAKAQAQPRHSGAVAATFNISLSQYGRARCYDNLFAAKVCAASAKGHFIGYSVRTADTRYTRWVNVTLDGVPFWQQVRLFLRTPHLLHTCTRTHGCHIGRLAHNAYIHTYPRTHTPRIRVYIRMSMGTRTLTPSLSIAC